MAIAPDTIEEKVLHWPAAQRIRLAEQLMASVEDFASPEIEAAWYTKIESRVIEIREGCAEGIPAEAVMKEARKELHEARRLSPTGRRRTHRVAPPGGGHQHGLTRPFCRIVLSGRLPNVEPHGKVPPAPGGVGNARQQARAY